jgi:hypothetical protein
VDWRGRLQTTQGMHLQLGLQEMLRITLTSLFRTIILILCCFICFHAIFDYFTHFSQVFYTYLGTCVCMTKKEQNKICAICQRHAFLVFYKFPIEFVKLQ